MNIENESDLPTAIIFDWDDTLVDNWESINSALNITLKAMGKEGFSLSKTRNRVRKSMRESFPVLFGKRWKEAADLFLNEIKKDHLTKLQVIRGIPSLLRGITDIGIPMGIVSNKNGDLLRNEVNFLGWEKLFVSIVGANDAEVDKPNKAPVILALKLGKIRMSSSIWFVGDAPSDMECAYNTGISPVLLHSEKYKNRDFTRFQPELLFASPKKMLNYLVRINR